MLEKPDAPDLLATAREVVLNELLPALPAEKAFAARMVANAIAIALREAKADVLSLPAADLAALAQEIRAGLHDPGMPTHEATRDVLRAYARLRASVSAPKALG
ncbi:DUF6285 domain-containing protein [Falsiroseomonas oryziterrae]|uniref:DUF6285 domain-containing protein n=1 Tax=Falsiroseomonas oryziterrae TaxID=2911368 RepID=UPI001F2F4391|nr:DUF6285 domain-containing protein [Roseomonas sp. NPKOSM-4]